jgi:hypothetical protein
LWHDIVIEKHHIVAETLEEPGVARGRGAGVGW